jgi:hypothetical protein
MSKSVLPVVLCLLLLGGCSGFKFEIEPARQKNLPEEIKKTPAQEPYRCVFTQSKIVIDGVFDEPDWQKAERIQLVKLVTLEEPAEKTEVQLMYDSEYLYVAFTAYDTDIWAICTERDAPLYMEDALEVFLKPASQKDPYYEFEVSPKNVVLDAYLGKRLQIGNMFTRWTQWNCKGLKTAVRINGTLNDWTDRDQSWTLEMAIPFKDLPSLEGRTPAHGDVWLFNVARSNYSIGIPDGQECTTYARITKFDFHRYEEWVNLVFE